MLNKYSDSVLAFPRLIKRSIVMIVDLSICFLSVYIAFYLRLGEWTPYFSNGHWKPWVVILASTFIGLPLFFYFGLYREIFRHSGLTAFKGLIKAGSIYFLFIALIFSTIGIQGVPRTIGIIQPFVLMALVFGSRAFAAYWLGNDYQKQLKLGTVPRALIYGAGQSGRQLASALANGLDMQIVGFLDDDPNLQGGTILGKRVFPLDRLKEIVFDLNISEVLLAIPSASKLRRNQIIDNVQDLRLKIRTLPSLGDIVSGKISINDLRLLDIDDLLGRDIVSPDSRLLVESTLGKTVLVTGAGGSIGSELCRQILLSHPAHLILVDQSEFALYQIYQELIKSHSKKNGFEVIISPILSTVTNGNRMRYMLLEKKPDIIYHAAAYKHVPLVEVNILDGIFNNAIGTLKIAQLAEELSVPSFVLISTDKAVRPTNAMGATKRLSEMILQALANRSNKTKFSMVRFGNVLDSSGSVVPVFKEQIKGGGPVTVTDFEMTRFFMTIPEAAQLVLQASTLAVGGEVFLLDMGSPVKILDLARKMIELSGLQVKDAHNPDGDIEIMEVGARPGEKLFEELLIDGAAKSTDHPKIFKAHEDFLPWEILENKLVDLVDAIERNDKDLTIKLLKSLVPGYDTKLLGH